METIVPRCLGLCVHVGREPAEKAVDRIQMVENHWRRFTHGGHISGFSEILTEEQLL